MLSPLQRLAAEGIWGWFDSLWEFEQVLGHPFAELCERVVPLLQRIDAGSHEERDALLVETIEFLRSLDFGTLRPR
jgi:hypothetical protein